MLRKYTKKFFIGESGEEGSQLLEWALLIGLLAALFIIIYAIFLRTENAALDAGKKIDEVDSSSTADWDSAKKDVQKAIDKAN